MYYMLHIKAYKRVFLMPFERKKIAKNCLDGKYKRVSFAVTDSSPPHTFSQQMPSVDVWLGVLPPHQQKGPLDNK